jgi:sodium-dependent dicarboxylate transporter 2/3/5
MMVVTLRPLLANAEADPSFRRALMLGVAFAADFGGMATPIGTGPNLIAIGAADAIFHISFLHWMLLGIPLTVLMVGLAFALLVATYRVRGELPRDQEPPSPTLTRQAWCVVLLFAVAVTGWVLEPVHGISAGVIALALAALLFATRLLDTADLANLEWDTLLLIAGGLTLGAVLETSGLTHTIAAAVAWDALPPTVVLFGFVVACALIAAVASNTAAAAMLIQLGMGIVARPSFAVLVAMAASMGVPFVISTPPNAMVYRHGDLRPRDLLVPGLILMVCGCVILALTGPTVLRWLGVP